jgi:DNA excision repair protein ERCC-5
LGLDRDELVKLAYLLGSDYVDGLPGVGPVRARELLAEFPGEDGLAQFKKWWLKVQNGKDTKEDNKSAFRRDFVRPS